MKTTIGPEDNIYSPHPRDWNELDREAFSRPTYSNYFITTSVNTHASAKRSKISLVTGVFSKISNVKWLFKDKYQKATRGWSDSDMWSLDLAIADTLGAQLLEFSKIAKGYPEGYEGGHKAWKRDILAAGVALNNYYTAKVTGEDERIEDVAHAREALRFVADNFEHLWS